jgi:hypothetical protein
MTNAFQTSTERPFDDLFNLHSAHRHRFPLTEAFCHCLNDERDNLRATYLDQVNRARRTEYGIPSIFTE